MYLEETFGILKDVDATVTKVGLLRTLDTAALQVFCSEQPLTFTAVFSSIPFFLKVPANPPRIFKLLYMASY